MLRIRLLLLLPLVPPRLPSADHHGLPVVHLLDDVVLLDKVDNLCPGLRVRQDAVVEPGHVQELSDSRVDLVQVVHHLEPFAGGLDAAYVDEGGGGADVARLEASAPAAAVRPPQRTETAMLLLLLLLLLLCRRRGDGNLMDRWLRRGLRLLQKDRTRYLWAGRPTLLAALELV